MKTTFAIAAVAAVIASAAPAFANSQLIASAGLTAEQAEGLTLNQIVAAKYNRGRSATDQQAVVIDRMGDPVVLETAAVDAYNAGKSFNDRQPAPSAGVTVASRGGSSAEDLEALAIDIYNRGKSFNDRQPVKN
jgi:hypothetical protein